MQHLLQEHPIKWAEYESLSSAKDKESFYQLRSVPYVSTLLAHFEYEGVIRFLINKSIVQVIVGELLFHPDDLESCTNKRALNLFVPLEQEIFQENNEKYAYVS